MALAVYFLPSYLTQKGKNLASKEDLEKLTEQVEGVKAQYSADLERLRFELGRAALIHKAQYETEFGAYKEIWPCLVEVQRTAAALRPMVDFSDAQDEVQRNRRMGEFGEAFNAMQNAIWKNKPFYSAAVHRELQELSRLAHGELIDYQHGDPHRDENYWQDMVKNIRAISTQINVVCEAIRQRVSTSDDALTAGSPGNG